MRTTLTLDADARDLLERHMRERHVSFKQAVNDAIRAGLARQRTPTEAPTIPRSLGRPTVPLDHALRVAAGLEDAELMRRLEQGR